MRVVMYVMNDVAHDSRVRREAATLAAAGHEVTIMATPLPETRSDPRDPDDLPGVRILRVAVPTGTPWWATAVRAPWRLPVLGSIALLPWTIVRAAWVISVNRLLGRPVQAGGIDFVRRWRVEWLGWCRSAVSAAPIADVHHAHDMEALPAARTAARRDGSRYVYDSHEIYMAWGPVLRQPRLVRRLVGAWERRLARGAAAVITIGEGVAGELAAAFGLPEILVVRNCPPKWQPPATPQNHIRRAAGIDPDVPLVLCHGGFMANRGLEQTAEAMLERGLEHAHLVFLGYRAAFLNTILGDPRLAGRVHYLPAVPPSDVVAWVAEADVDVIAIQPVDLNSRLSVPNKLFESLAGGVPVVSTDIAERRLILLGDPEGPLGALCDPTSPASIARAVRSILELDQAARTSMRTRILTAAHARWNWETESLVLIDLYRRLASDATGSLPI